MNSEMIHSEYIFNKFCKNDSIEAEFDNIKKYEPYLLDYIVREKCKANLLRKHLSDDVSDEEKAEIRMAAKYFDEHIKLLSIRH